MAYSSQREVSDGTLALLTISIEYFERSEISVYFDGVVDAYPWAWVGAAEKKISFTPAVPNGVEVMVLRTTDLSAIRHSLEDGAAFTDETMDENMKQVLHIAQEARENANIEDVYTDLNMHGYRVRNVGAAVDPLDAVNLQQFSVHDAVIAGYVDEAYEHTITAYNWAVKTDGPVSGGEYSSKWYSLVAKDWATKTGGTVDGSEYSAKHYSEVAAANAAAVGFTLNSTSTFTNKTILAGTNVVEATSGPDGAPFGVINHLRNPAFSVAQRGSTYSSGHSGYSFDRWFATLSNCGMARSGWQGGVSEHYVAITPSSATNSFQLDQPMESNVVRRLHGKQVTFSLYAWQSSGTQTITIGLSKNATENVRSTGTWSVIDSADITLTSSPTRFSITVTVPNDGTALGLMPFIRGVNRANGVTIAVTGTQLEVGSKATPLTMLPPAAEIVECERFYEARDMTHVVTFPCPSSGGYAISTLITCRVRKRYVPNFTYAVVGGTNYSSITHLQTSADGMQIQVVGASAGNTSVTFGNITFSSEIV